MDTRILFAAGLLVLAPHFASVGAAQDLAAIVFPEVDGWAKGTRYDNEPLRVKMAWSTINYTTKDKVGKDYIRADVQVTLTGGQGDQGSAAGFIENPVQKNVKKLGSEELKIGDKTVTRSTFSSSFGINNPVETELYVIPYGKHVIQIQHTGPAVDTQARSDQAGKLVAAIVAAAK